MNKEYKCIKCGRKLAKLSSETTPYLCEKCGLFYEKKDIQDIEDAEKIEEDMKIWRTRKK